MDVGVRELGIGMCLTGLILWVVGVAVDAPVVAIVLAIGILMGGAVLLARDDGAS